MKQVILMRTDLKMGKGKIAAQACHACLAAYKKTDKLRIRKWELTGQKKVVLKVSSESELLEMYGKIKFEGIPCALITDAPYSDDVIDELTGHLKLL